jgi:DNA-binding HxlR family transcriptional regulator
VSSRTYGQYCGFSRALELVGERWALLIIRDLLVGPKRYSDLQRGLAKIPSNILSDRLKELEEADIVQRRLLPRPSGAVVYELTKAGRDLEAPVIALGRWGAQRLGEPRPDEIVTEDSMATALMTTFRPEAAARANGTYELHVGEIVIHAQVRNGKLAVGRGPLPEADLIIEARPELRAVMAREITPDEALKKKIVRLRGNPKLFAQFVRMFQI